MAWLPAALTAVSTVAPYFLDSGSDAQVKTYNPYTKNQRKLIDETAEQSLQSNPKAFDWINQILSNDPAAFAEFENPIMRQYNEEIIPQTAERFTQLGAQRSSAFNQANAAAGANLSERLAALRGSLKQNAISLLQGFNDRGLTKTKTPYVQEGTPGIGKELGEGAANIINSIDWKDFLNKGKGATSSPGMNSISSGGLAPGGGGTFPGSYGIPNI